MKIGIITQPLGRNYGGMLQNWALQQVLKDMGHDPVTIDPGEPYSRGQWCYRTLKTMVKKALGRRCYWPMMPQHGRHGNPLTAPFIHKNIIMTRPQAGYHEDVIDNYGLEALVVGSDQVWRLKYNAATWQDQFLQFARGRDVRRVAYAASFGVDEWEYTSEQTALCAELLQRFNAVSVRESSAVQLCDQHYGVTPELVVDPTLLITSDRYAALCDDVPRATGDFIAVYCLDGTDATKAKIDKIAAALQLPVRAFSAHSSISLTVEQWLAMFRDSRAVITDSFHGTVFSAIFKKQAYIIPNLTRGGTRFHTLMALMGLSAASMSDEGILHLDPTEINETLSNEIAKSKRFLAASLG